MKAATIVGVLLIVLGVVGFAMGGFSFTHEKKDVDVGPVQISHDQKKTVPIPPALSIISLVAGVGPSWSVFVASRYEPQKRVQTFSLHPSSLVDHTRSSVYG